MEAISIKATVRSVLKERDASTSEATQREGRQGEGERTKLVRGQGFEVWALYRLTFPDDVGVKLPAQNSGSNPGQYPGRELLKNTCAWIHCQRLIKLVRGTT